MKERILKYLLEKSGGNITGEFLFSYVLWALIFIGVYSTVRYTIRYLKEYKVFSGIVAKIRGNTREYDRIRRQQLKQELEDRGQMIRGKDKKESLSLKLYRMIAMTGVTEKIPGFSESAFVAVMIVTDALISGVILWHRGIIVAAIVFGIYLIVMWYTLSLLTYNRRMKLESQLLQFINACTSASMQYSSIIDIFGAIYEQFQNPLRDALESCYVEAKQMSDKEAALKHLVEKFDSAQFAFVVENLELCSSVTGNYHEVARDISETVSIYINSHEKKRVTLRNAKINIFIMFVMSLIILYALSMFLGGLKDVLLNTFAGNMGLIALGLLLFYGMNMKAEK